MRTRNRYNTMLVPCFLEVTPPVQAASRLLLTSQESSATLSTVSHVLKLFAAHCSES